MDHSTPSLSFGPAWRWAGWFWILSTVVLVSLLAFEIYYFAFTQQGQLQLELSRLPPTAISFLMIILQASAAAILGLIILPLATLRKDAVARQAALETLLWPLIYLATVGTFYGFMMAHYQAHLHLDCDHDNIWGLPFLGSQALGILLSPLVAWRIRRVLRKANPV